MLLGISSGDLQEVKPMSLKESLQETIRLYEAIMKELRDYKSNEYKQGIAEGLEMALEAVKVNLEEHADDEG